MSKELLHINLKPILDDLKQIENLRLPFLQGLAHLLEHLSGAYTIGLGGTLLLHLTRWLEPEKLAERLKSWTAGEDVKIVTGEIYILYLLARILSQSFWILGVRQNLSEN